MAPISKRGEGGLFEGLRRMGEKIKNGLLPEEEKKEGSFEEYVEEEKRIEEEVEREKEIEEESS